MDPKTPSIPGKLRGNFTKHYAEGQKYLKTFAKVTGVDGWSIEIEGDINELASKAKYESGGIEIWNYGPRMGEMVVNYLKWISMMFDAGKPNTGDGIKEQFVTATPNRKIILRFVGEEFHDPHQRISFENGNMVITFSAEHFAVNLDGDITYCHLEDLETFWDPK